MTEPRKIAIVGTGAMGSVYAVLLAEAGHEIWAVDGWQDHVDAINSKGPVSYTHLTLPTTPYV